MVKRQSQPHPSVRYWRMTMRVERCPDQAVPMHVEHHIIDPRIVRSDAGGPCSPRHRWIGQKVAQESPSISHVCPEPPPGLTVRSATSLVFWMMPIVAGWALM